MNRAVARVDLDAIRANLAVLRRRAGEADVMAVVKADAYGHGMAEVARTARGEGVTWLGVALPSEACELRRLGDAGRILTWLWTPGDPNVSRCVAEGIDVSVSSPWAVDEITDAARAVGRVARVHVKVDTGLTRNGVLPADLPGLLGRVRDGVDAGLLEVEGIWSHLADGDTPDAASVAHQRARFDEALVVAARHGVEPRLRHLGNSGSVFAHPACRYDLVRAGISLYGLSPSGALGRPADLGLTPAMTVLAGLAHVKHVEVGTAVSYGWRWVAEEATSLGLVPVGYADGVPRAAGAPRVGSPVEVVVAGHRVPIVGTVAMDQFVVDLGDVAAAPGDEVILFGSGAAGEWTADQWADTIGTIGYEIITRIGPRVPREYVGLRTRAEEVGP